MFKKLLAFFATMYMAVSFAAVDVNKATAAELDGIKGIGPAISGKIVDERKKGNFKDWNDFIDRVKGVGEGNAAKFSAEGLTVGGAGYKGVAAPAAAAVKKDVKPAAPAAGAKADDKKAAPAVAAPMAKDEKKDAKAEAKAKKEADKKAKAEEKKKKADEEKAKADAAKAAKADAKKAKDAKPVAKDEKKDAKADAAKPAASAAKK